MIIGFDVAGVVVSVGAEVTKFKPGDEVYACVSGGYQATIAQYCLSLEEYAALKPASLSFTEAAAVPMVGLTALQAFNIAEKQLPGGLKGKTIFVTAGLSGTGHLGVQLAKNIFGAGKVITTLSTGKIPKIKEYLAESIPDQLVDYTKGDVVNTIGEGTVDFMFDTTASTISDLAVMKKGGMIVTISNPPSGSSFKKETGRLVTPRVLSWLPILLNFVNWVFKTWTGWKGVKYEALLTRSSGVGSELESLTEWIEEGKVKIIVGRIAKLEDIEEVRGGCQQILDKKGGVGKFVVNME